MDSTRSPQAGSRPFLRVHKLWNISSWPKALSKKRATLLFNVPFSRRNGWGTRIRTWVNGARTRRPAARRSPSICKRIMYRIIFSESRSFWSDSGHEKRKSEDEKIRRSEKKKGGILEYFKNQQVRNQKRRRSVIQKVRRRTDRR